MVNSVIRVTVWGFFRFKLVSWVFPLLFFFRGLFRLIWGFDAQICGDLGFKGG